MYKRVESLVFFISMGMFGICLSDRPNIHSVQQIQALFPATKQEIDELVNRTIKRVQSDVSSICCIEKKYRTFDNTFIALDKAIERQKIVQSSLYVLSLASPDGPLRQAAQAGVTLLNACSIDSLTLNQELYDACKEYSSLRSERNEKISAEKAYFIDEIMGEFRRNGLQLTKEQQMQVQSIQKELAALTHSYEAA